ncbi:energy-coupling factor transporter transmembrane component T family protein [Natronorarus salvus]|uniref:energy-coupling factor transporter transmembrane component T family protein n=1 Tax=Natronorarus salvus TaxID=3117733 RepID=UPI002F26BCC0
MLSYSSGASFAHRLDARSKLAFQLAFVAVAYAYTTPRGLLALSGLVVVVLLASRTPLFGTLWTFRIVFPFVLAAPLIEAAVLGPPWIALDRAVDPVLASYRILLVLLVAAAYVRTTPIRDSQAALAWTLPGRAGRFLGLGVGFVARFLPLLVEDLQRARAAHAARLGTEQPIRNRISWLVVAGVSRTLSRADRLSLALRARCLSWNATLPELRFSWRDTLVSSLAISLLVGAISGSPVLP